jgi:hypothetical protein
MSGEGNHRRERRQSLVSRLLSIAPPERAEEPQDRLLQTCPACAESVYILADRCRHCGAVIPTPRVA